MNNETILRDNLTTLEQGKLFGQNRKQRRAQAKKDKQFQKRLSRYLKKHPEAIKVDLDEDAIKELEAKEQNLVTDETKD